FKERLHRALKAGAFLAEFGVIDDLCGNASGVRKRKTAGVWPVGDYQRDFGGGFFVLRCFNRRSHVGAASGYQTREPFSSHVSPKIELSVINDALFSRRLDDGAKFDRRLGRAREELRDRVSVSRRYDDNHSNTAIESSQHFILRDTAFECEPSKHREEWHSCEINARAELFGQNRRNAV